MSEQNINHKTNKNNLNILKIVLIWRIKIMYKKFSKLNINNPEFDIDNMNNELISKNTLNITNKLINTLFMCDNDKNKISFSKITKYFLMAIMINKFGFSTFSSNTFVNSHIKDECNASNEVLTKCNTLQKVHTKDEYNTLANTALINNNIMANNNITTNKNILDNILSYEIKTLLIEFNDLFNSYSIN